MSGRRGLNGTKAVAVAIDDSAAISIGGGGGGSRTKQDAVAMAANGGGGIHSGKAEAETGITRIRTRIVKNSAFILFLLSWKCSFDTISASLLLYVRPIYLSIGRLSVLKI